MKIAHGTLHPTLLSIAFAAATVAALITGLLAAHRWYEASRVQIDPGWRQPGPPQSAADAQRSIEPVIPELRQMELLAATMEAAKRSADLNRRAARLTAMAVVLSAVSSILGALAGWFSPQ
jgi:hypothetical protein